LKRAKSAAQSSVVVNGSGYGSAVVRKGATAAATVE
jgi:hypothetical protein